MAKKLSLLNKKQRKWLDNFLKDKPHARLTNVYDLLDGDRVIEVEWWEHTIPVVLDSHTFIRGNISYKLKVKLRKFGDPRKTANFSYKMTPAQKQTVPYRLKEQLSLELPQAYLIPTPQNPVVVKTKEVKQKRSYRGKVTHVTQQTLPLSGITAQLNEINLKSSGVPLSEQELLLETTPHFDLDTGKEIKLPTAIIKILNEKKASFQEWESAISLYQVAGASAILQYLNELDNWRNYHGNQSVKHPTIRVRKQTENEKVNFKEV
ncbi:hypothetical protein DP113_33890 (plasmid) [Brasilonema octagenarum UFV-E1]|uniref:Uncharacterized protein n=2 Tax=Brasilonema TaxID=383614 RepID=A0A856MQ79_9CYAN|nr:MULTISPECIES: hypothetical protein [Brasilonema]NMF65947.1 hypothetical protein [Brasilonema octagenarum UFV-OR1]QDL12712.1 hypothetical protein DP114_33780 [Brasilonema sennae CENA114]QDL19107.1 hypothetical protein DP113_33890 [Brasilonema octagenarum UFV-E1]